MVKIPSNNTSGSGASADANTPAGGAAPSEYAAQFLLTLTYSPQLWLSDVRGVPQALQVLVQVPSTCPTMTTTLATAATASNRAPAAHYELLHTTRWLNKSAAHAPEAFWLVNRPVAPDRNGWRLNKLG